MSFTDLVLDTAGKSLGRFSTSARSQIDVHASGGDVTVACGSCWSLWRAGSSQTSPAEFEPRRLPPSSLALSLYYFCEELQVCTAFCASSRKAELEPSDENFFAILFVDLRFRGNL